MTSTSRNKRPAHAAAFCEKVRTDFSGSMAKHSGGWVSKHRCPICQRETGFLANNYLGGGKLVCTGERLFRPHEQNAGKLGWNNMRALLRQHT
jgi:hypothetical protein